MRLYLRRAFIALLCLALVLLAIPVLMRASVGHYIHTIASSTPQAQVALVLGAAVAHGKPSPILSERAASAVELYKAGKVSKILVTGDNGELSHDEVTPVKDFLLQQGVAAGDIFLDHAGFDTYSSMYRARDVFGAKTLIIVTQDFHLPRALFIARYLGLDASGLVAPGGDTLYEYLREIPASAKALMDLFFRREPKYLGPEIPLTGDGSTTWY
jgi:SanA protein